MSDNCFCEYGCVLILLFVLKSMLWEKIPKSKLQISDKLQIVISKIPNKTDKEIPIVGVHFLIQFEILHLKLGIYLFFEICYLRFCRANMYLNE